jgi:hypothetical protein
MVSRPSLINMLSSVTSLHLKNNGETLRATLRGTFENTLDMTKGRHVIPDFPSKENVLSFLTFFFCCTLFFVTKVLPLPFLLLFDTASVTTEEVAEKRERRGG